MEIKKKLEFDCLDRLFKKGILKLNYKHNVQYPWILKKNIQLLGFFIVAKNKPDK